MTALIIDTSGPQGVLACSMEGTLTQTFPLPAGRPLTKHLFTTLLSFGKQKIDFIAVGVGPGTFTGTRVGAMTAQALAFGWGIPLVSFSSAFLPDLPHIALTTYHGFLSGLTTSQIQLVYISPNIITCSSN